ncbi:histidinol-phosphate transaminase [Gimesia maris]|uniref:Histidinol-phosphate aminotransferase n=1 Tax=Gimesia maris TaxID=122 RepID=A0ABX5YGI0_9PLAN|nr:histidinol-phosphate transaminase [Gimesia maris]EDL61797.1 histidinol-phosphate aminotransferase [Gimesia maris DSM 8797]QEG14819.1 Histidinol-phosphate aminotransferase [Gimesia maris]QGQ31790.1 histidinol-phosphate transaminase [Gimesia maris]
MSLFRPQVQQMTGYTPGEQPQESGWVKLNTNENPYPPSPLVKEAVEQALSGRLNIYPDPLATEFRKVAADLFQVEPDWILPGNGSDEVLTILMRTFADAGDLVSAPYPSYTLYETLAEIQGARFEKIQLNPDWSWPVSQAQAISGKSKILFVPNPNAPSGNRWTDDEILSLVPPQGVLVLDEAYGDFCDQPHKGELLKSKAGERIIVTRTFSKSYSLAGIRFGFAVAHPKLIQGMQKVKDSYNCNTLSLAAALAAMKDQEWMQANTKKIQETRARLVTELNQLGFDTVDSQTNFVWCTHPDQQHERRYQELKRRKILVRYMKFGLTDGVLDGLRITVGTDDEVQAVLNALQEIG